jgi:hypothetical protein
LWNTSKLIGAPFQVGCRAFDHDVNLNTATKGVAVEIERHRSW